MTHWNFLVDSRTGKPVVCVPSWPFVSEKLLSNPKRLSYSTQRNFHFNGPSAHQQSIVGILEPEIM